jgi:hypothetical protein
MAMIKKKGMGKPMRKAQKGGIISESGDLADALNEYEAMKKKGTVPKTDAEARKYMDGVNKRGMLGTPGIPRKPAAKPPVKAKPKAKNGGSFPDLNKDGKITKADILKGRGVIAKKGAKVKKK